MRAALLLAAGSSRRFGRGDKLMAPLWGKPLIAHAIDRALETGVRRLIVVVPSRGGRVGRNVAALPDRRLRLVTARRHREGLGASLAAGLRAVRPIERELLIFLGDMPFAAAPRLLALRPGIDAARPMVSGTPGHPLLVRTRVARRALGQGDRGLALRLLRIGTVRGQPGHVLDVDTPAALARARRMGSLRRR